MDQIKRQYYSMADCQAFLSINWYELDKLINLLNLPFRKNGKRKIITRKHFKRLEKYLQDQ
jgi:hypothetical protein